jgi:hypothetical protein
MSSVDPFALFCVTGAVWCVTCLCASRLLCAFRERFPSVAAREIPYAFDRWFNHPEKTVFFFRRRAAEVLRGDPLLWRLRQRLMLLYFLSILIPLLGFMSIGIVAFLETHK